MEATVSQVLDVKGHSVWHVSPQATVYEALKIMSDKGIGALVVMQEGKVIGIFSERDYARKIVLEGKSSKDTPVADVMTRTVFYVTPWRTVDECMALMTAERLRHLPVIEDGKVVGLVSIGDVVKAIISEQKFAIEELQAFVTEALKDRAAKDRRSD
jgi:CBS domain-containing protein